MTKEQRKHPRTPIKLTVALTLDNGEKFIAETWDISDGGIGIHFSDKHNIVWSTGMPVKAQVQGLPIEGPELPMKVVRIEQDRIGLKLI
jgi:c-di-GMP-binding flagellar brake protein YcgR